MIDGHCHLCAEDFAEDIAEVVERAKAAGVRACLVNTETVKEFERSLSLSRLFPNFCVPCAGVHPVQYATAPLGPERKTLESRSVRMEDLEGMAGWLEQHHEEIVALGEVGLDFSPRYIDSPADKEAQRAVLREQVRLAKLYGLPLISHSRSAGKPTIQLFREEGAEKVLLHAFDGSPKSAKEGIAAGFFFSIPPCIVREEQKRNLVKALPLEHILLETDAPVLGPTREERNEPANLVVALEAIAELKGVSKDELVRVTTANAHRCFPKLRGFLGE